MECYTLERRLGSASSVGHVSKHFHRDVQTNAKELLQRMCLCVRVRVKSTYITYALNRCFQNAGGTSLPGMPSENKTLLTMLRLYLTQFLSVSFLFLHKLNYVGSDTFEAGRPGSTPGSDSKPLFLLHNSVQNSSGAHPVSYLMGPEGSLPRTE